MSNLAGSDEGRILTLLTDGVEELPNTSTYIVVCLSLTANPDTFEETIKKLNFPVVRIMANKGRMSNGALAHSEEGVEFRKE